MLKILYKVLQNPKIYNTAQTLLGGNRVYREIRGMIGAQLKDIEYNNVLDAGCGTGIFADCFKGTYTGVDISGEYIEHARSSGRGTFVVADATALPFKDETFDLVFTLGVLHHLDAGNCERMLGEMWRVCKAGGHILIVDGLVPSNRLNIIGYILAKLDRGRFKVRIEDFKAQIASAYPDAERVMDNHIKIFPYELIARIIRK
jgi:ubiquinone/menaquinone biosynthesis C-methylase UbiE